MTLTPARWQRVLQLALTSPYSGEREKAVALLIQFLDRGEIHLHQLDHSFAAGEGAEELRKRAGLASACISTFKSREEATLYRHLVKRFTAQSASPPSLTDSGQGYTVISAMTPAVETVVELAYRTTRVKLQTHLASAQQQALTEYHARRQQLFDEAIEALAQSGPGKAVP